MVFTSTRPQLVNGRVRAVPPSATATLDARLKELAAGGGDVVNLTSGEVDFPTPPQAGAAGTEAINDGFTRYTAVPGMPELRAAIASWLLSRRGVRYPSDEIVVSNGAKHALFNTFMVLLEPGDEVLLPAPYWVSFPQLIAVAGGVAVTVPAGAGTGFKVTPDMLRSRASSRTKAVIINNPVNPTGAVYSRAELEAIAEAALGLGLVIVSDEIYDELVYPPAEFTSMAALDDEVKNRTVVIGGVSKTFAMTGWRIGYAASPAEMARAMTAFQGHTTSAPSSVSQRAAFAALTDPAILPELARRRASLDQRRRELIDGLAPVPGVRVPAEPAGAFYALAEVASSYGRHDGGAVIDSAGSFARALLDQEGVGVVPGDSFGAPAHVRISYVVDGERLREGINRIARFAAAIRPAEPGNHTDPGSQI